MKIIVLAIILFGLSTFPTTAAKAEWQVIEKIDAITDEKELSAEVHNADGYRFSIYRSDSGSVFSLFSITGKELHTIAPQKSLWIRIDKHKAHEIKGNNPLEKYGIKTFYWNPGFVNFLIWHGKEDEGISSLLKEMMSGSNLIVRFPVGTGGTIDVSFQLNNSGEAIVKALGIKGDEDTLKKAREFEKYKAATSPYMNGCIAISDSRKRSACVKKQITCSEMHPPPDWRGVKGCLAKE